MTTLTFRSNVRTAFAAGVSCPIPPTITIDVDPADLTPDQRSMLAQHMTDEGHIVELCVRDESWRYGEVERNEKSMLTAVTPDLAGLFAALDKSIVGVSIRRAELETQRLEKAEEVRARTQAVLDERQTDDRGSPKAVYLDGTVSDWRGLQDQCGPIVGSFRLLYADWPVTSDKAVRESAAAVAWEAELVSQNEATAAELVLRYKSEALDRLDWIELHGSANLRRMLAESMDYSDLYASERAEFDAQQLVSRLATERPGWRYYDGAELPAPSVQARAVGLCLTRHARQLPMLGWPLWTARRSA